MDRTTYSGNTALHVDFANESPQSDTWIGIYPAGSDENSLPSPSTMWLYACEDSNGSSGCIDGAGTITFDENA